MNTKQIERSIAELTKRVQALHGGDFVRLSFHSGAWQASTCFTDIRSGGHDTPQKAIAFFIEELRRHEGAKQAA